MEGSGDLSRMRLHAAPLGTEEDLPNDQPEWGTQDTQYLEVTREDS